MSNTRSNIQDRAGVYARVLFDASKSLGETGPVQSRNELQSTIALLGENVDVRSYLTSADNPKDKKLELLKTLTQGKNEVLCQVLKNMVENGDFGSLKVVLRKLEELIEKELKLCIVDVTTAVELDDKLRTLVKDKAKKELGLDAILNEVVDKSILGGIIMSVNGKCIDASMITQLNHARSVLKAS